MTIDEVYEQHDSIHFDLTTPRQYTANGGWNQSCRCGLLLGDATDEEGQERINDLHRDHLLEEIQKWMLSPEVVRMAVEAMENTRFGDPCNDEECTSNNQHIIRAAFKSMWSE